MSDMERARQASMSDVAALQLLADTIGDLLAEVVPELDAIVELTNHRLGLPGRAWVPGDCPRCRLILVADKLRAVVA